MSEAAAAALELMHCASLVHDDLPCFDDAGIRRGKPSVHAIFGEPIALLAGDAMIVLAFEVLARAGPAEPKRSISLVRALAAASGSPYGICAGQGWESESEVKLELYHRAKTGALFVAATTMGALAAGQNPGAWRPLGEKLGEAYQVADDLRDVLLSAEELGKPANQDDAHGRPNAVCQMGVAGAKARLEELLRLATESIPSCPGDTALRNLVMMQAKRLTPQQPAAHVA
jgi:geranylgeranyl diphosphate synthase type II